MNELRAMPQADAGMLVPQPATLPVTIVTATRPKVLSKQYSVDAAGQLEKRAGGILVEGHLEIRNLDGLRGLAQLLPTLSSAQALIYGLPRDSAAKQVVTKNLLATGKDVSGKTARTNADFRWPNGPGFMMIDYDPEPGKAPRSREELVAEIRDAAPGLMDHSMLWWMSASSAIWEGERELRGVTGQRLWLHVADAADIPRAGKVLADRLWLSDHGTIRVSSSGSMLERTLVDTAVWQPSRLDFAGGAECVAPLTQKRGCPELITAKHEVVDTKLIFADLSEAEQRHLGDLKKAARVLKEAEASERRAEWERCRMEKMLRSSGTNTIDAQQDSLLRQVLENAITIRDLQGQYVLEVEVEGSILPITVSQILANPAMYDGRLCQDPLEPEYDGGRLVGKLFIKNGNPVLHSFARGGATYRLRSSRIPVEYQVGKTSQLVQEIIQHLQASSVYYDYGQHLVLIDDGGLYTLSEDSLRYQLGLDFVCHKEVHRQKVECEFPQAVGRLVIAQRERRKLKPLNGVLTGPTVRPDGTVLKTPGYDQSTRLYLDLASKECRIPDEPSLTDAVAALQTLMAPFAQFPFVDAHARGAHLSAMLTAVVRPTLETAPAFGYDAPTAGTGKTLLASCVAALAEGKKPDVWPHICHEEEIRKRLLSALVSGARAMVWDNVVGEFDSAAMAALMTSLAFIDRVLGKSEALRIPNKLLVNVTGNNLVVKGDLMRRMIICRVDAGIAEPYARTFDSDPLTTCIEQRNALLEAACTLMRARFTLQPTPLGAGRLAAF